MSSDPIPASLNPLTTRTYTYKTQPPPSSQPILATAHFLPPPHFPPTSSRPLALFFHGGAFMIGSKDAVPMGEVDYLARDHGFVVASVDYSLCPQVTLKEGALEDAKDAYRWCKEVLPGLLEAEEEGVKVKVDRSRICVVGHSAGGLLAMSTAFLPNPPLAILDFYGMKYLRDPWWTLPNYSKPVPDFPDSYTSQVFTSPDGLIPTNFPIYPPSHPDFKMTPRLAYLLGSLKDGTSIAKLMGSEEDYELVDSAARWGGEGGVEEFKGKTEFLFVHGNVDELVPVGLAERAVEELNKMGVEAEVLKVEGAKHAFDFLEMVGRGGKWWGEVEKALEWVVSRVGEARV